MKWTFFSRWLLQVLALKRGYTGCKFTWSCLKPTQGSIQRIFLTLFLAIQSFLVLKGKLLTYMSQSYWRIAVFLNLYLVNWPPRIYCDPELILCTLTFLSRRCVSCFSIPLKITIICLSLNNFPFSKKLTTTLIFHSSIPRNAKRI